MNCRPLHALPALLLHGLLFTSICTAQNPDSLWHQFTGALLRDEITAARLRPYHPGLTEPLLGFLKTLRSEIPALQWEQQPEAHRVGDKIHYVIPFTEEAETSVFCFTLTTESDAWYFTHMENIFIRLDRVTSLPTSTFPDLPGAQKAWMREEKYWSQIVYFYNMTSNEKGKEHALNLLKDGHGYFLEAKTWVPFVEPRRAFVLYLCWEQSVLRGNEVTLMELNDTLARVSARPIFFQLYKRAAHLKNQIPFQEYRQIFETLWQNRAQSAGWELTIEFPNDEECVFLLRAP